MKLTTRQRTRADQRPGPSTPAKAAPGGAPGPTSATCGKTGPVPTHEEIVTAAEALWRGKGCPSGCDYDIWLEAERDLRHPGNGRDGAAFANPQPLLGQRGDDLMTELNERFPGPTGKETTSL